ncbi:Agamous-like MADS-box protein AGL62 [Striga hermonthica]|uniref:Agamous-like MADS-box protein AGL62 n=1 Tax=Striga hermonthica TaxID=68872 RepID=A0A9N7QZP9_STRHE|nr:Agamous-like MADS-box protein AGL62 [Striga hermonthica]
MSSSNQAPPKKSRGRQKVNMVKMSNESNLQVTFSKRRAGLFKKASELCTLCGVEAAIVVFSPADKAFCFGHPNVQTVIDRFEPKFPQIQSLANNNARSQLIIDAHRNSTIRELNLELTQIEGLMRAEKRRAEELDLMRKSGQVQGWFLVPSDGFDFASLRMLKESIMNFKKDLDVKMQNHMFTLVNPPTNFTSPPPGFKLGNPGGGIDGNLASCAPTFAHNNARLSLGSNDFNHYDNNSYHGAIGLRDNIGLIGPPKHGTMNYGSIDHQALIGPNLMSGNNIFPSDPYQRASGKITTALGSSQVFNNMPFDPRLL